MSKKTKSILGALALIVVLIAASIAVMPSKETPGTSNAPVNLSNEASLTLLGPTAGSVEVGELQKVRWISSNYGATTVAVNIIRKVSDNPARYELVRTVAASTAADGEAVWVPAKSDVGTNIFVEIGCSLSEQACRGTVPTMALAVVDTGRNANTAAAYQAIEAEENN